MVAAYPQLALWATNISLASPTGWPSILPGAIRLARYDRDAIRQLVADERGMASFLTGFVQREVRDPSAT